MSLSEIIAGDFFNTYIKRGMLYANHNFSPRSLFNAFVGLGNILMISEGRPGIDNRYTLRDGIV